MPRKARARTFATSAALAAVLAAGTVACSGSDTDNGSGDGDAAGQTAATEQAAPPGKYRTLPEPCGAVGQETLAGLFPAVKPAKGGGESGGAAVPPDSPYGGEPDLTYDTDRRVGCTWQHNTSLGSRRLSVDFERVVSYDTTVSDDEEATRLFSKRAGKAGLAAVDDKATGGAGNASEDTGSQGTEAQGGEQAPVEDGGGEAGSPSPHMSATPAVEPTPRLLEGIGDSAYLDDDLSGDDGTSRRTVTLVFRTANVLVTVEYTQTMTDGHRTPDAEELEAGTQDLARTLVGRFED